MLDVEKDFGAVGDGVTDDSTAIQNAIDAAHSYRGADIYFPGNRYFIAEPLQVDHQGTWLVGRGGPGTRRSQAQGSTRIITRSGIVGITCNPDGTHATLGYGFTNLHVLAESGAVGGGGILVRNAEKTIVRDVTCSDYTSGFGFKIDGLSGNAHYAEFQNYSGGDSQYGLHLTGTAPNRLLLNGGYFQGNGALPRPGSVGIYVERGDTAKIFGPAIQGYETGIHIASPAAGHEIHGLRSENNKIGVRFSNTIDPLLLGGSFVGGALSGPKIGVQIDVGVTGARVLPAHIAGIGTPILDNGSGTKGWGDA